MHIWVTSFYFRLFCLISRCTRTLRRLPHKEELEWLLVSSSKTFVSFPNLKLCFQAQADQDIADAVKFSEIRYQSYKLLLNLMLITIYWNILLFYIKHRHWSRRWVLRDEFYYVSRVEMTDILIYSFQKFRQSKIVQLLFNNLWIYNLEFSFIFHNSFLVVHKYV